MFRWSTFLAYIFVTAYTPGPNNILSMGNASRYGFRKSFPFNLGIWAGFSVVMLLCALFSAALYAAIPSIKLVMQLLGAGYMVYLAAKTLLHSSQIAEEKTSDLRFITGALLQLINPKIIIYGITAMSSYILPHYNAPAVVVLFALLLAFVGFSGTVCWALFGAVFHKLFSQHAKLVNYVIVALLLYCAVSLFM